MAPANARTPWAGLPGEVRHQIETITGPHLGDETVATGRNCQVATVLHTAAGSYFLKGVDADDPRAVRTHGIEAAVNSHVGDLTATMVFRVQLGGWDILGFEYLDGHHHADLTPDSPDLPLIAKTLHALSQRTAPADPAVRAIEDRWRHYVGDRAHLLAGSTLAHTDLHGHNILVGKTAKLIDWAWPTSAAPWIDTACVAVQLIQAGHPPAAAEAWCHHVPAYRAAEPEAVSAFVDAASRLWQEIANDDDQPWKLDMAAAAQSWAAHRSARSI